ncbi:MAG: TonB-dependent receptor plug domain-containing protein [Bacteroidia bacterium]|nr:TonB-dependent receptor plug domain-containing protein [Bacteroidia bacterium]
MKSKIFLLTILILTLSVSAYAQKSGKKYYITGQVLDIYDQPVSGAMVFIDNKKSDVITDDKGMYKVKVKADAVKISILKLSSDLLNEEINGRTVINFKLNNEFPHEEAVKQENTDNEVVNIGYGYSQKKDLTTTVGNIDGQNKKYGSYQSIFDMIKELPGVQVVDEKIRIRGIATMNGSTDPLILVDGIEMSLQGLQAIVPRLVKSINVLNSSDAAIYGSKGANGVILIALMGK